MKKFPIEKYIYGKLGREKIDREKIDRENLDRENLDREKINREEKGVPFSLFTSFTFPKKYARIIKVNKKWRKANATTTPKQAKIYKKL